MKETAPAQGANEHIDWSVQYQPIANRWKSGLRAQGVVTLVGAGPGDPELITVKGLRALEEADVILYDRLISTGLLEFARDDALKINVGKQPKRHRVPQEEISQFLLKFAQSGNKVVRLKGGDPFVFGRGYEELNACRETGITCHVIPGITSAIAGPAAAGIPVTSRGVSRSFAVVTAESGAGFDDPNHDFAALAQLDTLVILMGRRTLARTTTELIRAGKSADTPVACIERATFPSQRVLSGTLQTIVDLAETQCLESPMVTVVGEVARYAEIEQIIPAPAEMLVRSSKDEAGQSVDNFKQKTTS